MTDDYTYYSRSPGHVCERCGKDISNRHRSTKYCRSCYNELAKERKHQQELYHAHLEARDKVSMRNCCKEFTSNTKYIFCPVCGQRIKEG